MKNIQSAVVLILLASGCTTVQSNSSKPAHDTTLSEAPATEIGRSVIIIGVLGVPIGTTVKISGYVEDPTYGFFRVEEVNGKKANAQVLVDGANKWEKGTKATIEGYEYGKICLLERLPHNLPFGPGLKRQSIDIRFHVLTDEDRTVDAMIDYKQTK